jgi:hypothetical protein
MRKLYPVLLAAVLAGCAGTPMGQGGRPEVLFASNDMIRIRWDPQLTKQSDVRSVAMAFCGGRKVDELSSSLEAGASGGLQAKTWQCEAFPGIGGGR